MEFIRPKRATLRLDLAPLIDVVFQLLIFFMLTSSFMHPTMRLKLPTATSHEQADPEQLVVTVDEDGRIFVNAEEVAKEYLRATLQARLTRLEKKQINFRGDHNMRYQLFVEVMDIAKQAGAVQLNLVHETARE